MVSPLSLSSATDAVLASSTLVVRYYSFLFVRHHPLGPRYLHQIYYALAVYLACVLARLWLARRKDGSEKRSRLGALLTLIFGIPDRARPLLSVFSCLLNLLCVAAAVDFVYRAHFLHQSSDLSFSRVGHVDQKTASIVVRAPGVSAVEISTSLADGSDFHAVQTVPVSEKDDFVGTFHLRGLHQDTEYSYRTNASHTGSFRTAQKDPKKWTMLSTSCIKPFYPYNPTDHALRVRGLEHVDGFISRHAVDFMLFLGDFIYIDLPYPLGWSREHYTSAYRQVYASPSWSPALRSLPWIHAYDDHEIINDWSANETGLYQEALPPYWSYQGNANPVSAYGEGESFYTFKHGDVSFFVLDTRRYRSDSKSPDGPEKMMLGAKQLEALKKWLRTERSWKVIVSGVPFTRNWRGPDSNDAWSGYLWERERIFDEIRKTDGVLLLSGDRHEHATTIFPPAIDGKGKPIIEFSTSALNQFFEPFSRFHRQVEDSDVAVYNHYKGNSKFAAISFDTSVRNRWMVHFDLMIDGEKAWEYDWKYEK